MTLTMGAMSAAVREWVAYKLYNAAYRLSLGEAHVNRLDFELVIRDPNGAEVFNVMFNGGFVASGPDAELAEAGWTFLCRHGVEVVDLT